MFRRSPIVQRTPPIPRVLPLTLRVLPLTLRVVPLILLVMPLILLTGLLLAACGDEIRIKKTVTAEELIAEGPHDHAIIEIRDIGSIRIQLLPELAPQAVENFIKLGEAGFYEGILFHRVIPGFMIQAGDPTSRNPDPRLVGGGGPGYQIRDEFSDFPHTRGVVSMANKGFPNSAGSQFFIVHQDSAGLDGQYSVFGRIVEGIAVVDAITEVEIDTYGRYGPPDRPHPVPVVIDAMRIERASAISPVKRRVTDARRAPRP